MKKILMTAILLTTIMLVSYSRTIYVATTGNDSNPGTETSPYLNIQKAIDAAAPGDTIYIRGGTYMLTKRIKIEKAGTADARICLWDILENV